METCETCDKRGKCEKLCKKVEKIVNQDNVMLKEVLLDSIDIFSESVSYGLEKYTKKSVINLYKDGKSAKDIAYHVPFDKSYIYKIIKRFKRGEYE